MKSEPAARPQDLARKAIERCTNCDWCRDYLKDSSCLFFRRLYRLHDREKAGGRPASDAELKRLVDLCNSCGICPCVEIRTWVREAKDGFMAQSGVPAAVRVLEDVRLLAKLGGIAPRVTNFLLKDGPVGRGIKRLTGIHPERKLPRFPVQSFDGWAKAKGLHRPPQTAGRKVAYFTGCTARYLFPEVAKATVEVLERNGVAVYVPPQRCCGMPTMLEGDREFTFKTASFNFGELMAVVDAGYDIVTSCPTCGYFLKSVQSADALHSPEFAACVRKLDGEEGGDLVKIGARLKAEEPAFNGRRDPAFDRAVQPSTIKFARSGLLRDRSYFDSFDGIKRLRIASRTYDLGEYLRDMHGRGELNVKLGPVPEGMAYFAPCHQREQGIGQPWTDLLALVPGNRVGGIGNAFDCCGLGGLMGFKKNFHSVSVAIGRRLRDKTEAADPSTVLTDCLSCRLQFEQMQQRPVAHPVEILRAAYRSGDETS
jgi:glycerol-3-phosphate dehydrogenase subunit C